MRKAQGRSMKKVVMGEQRVTSAAAAAATAAIAATDG